MKYDQILVNVDELWLKGRNRPYYLKCLRRHVTNKCKSLGMKNFRVKNINQRLVIEPSSDVTEELINHLQMVPGVYTIQPVVSCERDIEVIKETARKVFEAAKIKFPKAKTFRVTVQRKDKTFEISSMEFARHVSGRILANNEEFKVNLKNPDLNLNVKIQPGGRNYIYAESFPGVGGLPAGTSGHSITMLSGGFDSPVASYMMMSRGVHQSFAFFYAYPFVGDEVKEKIISLSKHLAKFLNNCQLHIIPFGHVQDYLARNSKEEYRTILFRYAMVKCANLLAPKIGAEALVTGDSLGQVSSQTMGNISLIDKASDLPILRPLIGMHKKAIIKTAVKIGTHDISVIPHDDACSLFAPENPIIRPHGKTWEDMLSQLDLEPHLNQALEETELYTLSTLGQFLDS